LSSFSSSREVATRFADYENRYVYKASIPAKFIASTFFTGYGCAEEQEYIVWGGSRVVRHIKKEDK
jgi:hypothetical protein